MRMDGNPDHRMAEEGLSSSSDTLSQMSEDSLDNCPLLHSMSHTVHVADSILTRTDDIDDDDSADSLDLSQSATERLDDGFDQDLPYQHGGIVQEVDLVQNSQICDASSCNSGDPDGSHLSRMQCLGLCPSGDELTVENASHYSPLMFMNASCDSPPCSPVSPDQVVLSDALTGQLPPLQTVSSDKRSCACVTNQWCPESFGRSELSHQFSSWLEKEDLTDDEFYSLGQTEDTDMSLRSDTKLKDIHEDSRGLGSQRGEREVCGDEKSRVCSGEAAVRTENDVSSSCAIKNPQGCSDWKHNPEVSSGFKQESSHVPEQTHTQSCSWCRLDACNNDINLTKSSGVTSCAVQTHEQSSDQNMPFTDLDQKPALNQRLSPSRDTVGCFFSGSLMPSYSSHSSLSEHRSVENVPSSETEKNPPDSGDGLMHGSVKWRDALAEGGNDNFEKESTDSEHVTLEDELTDFTLGVLRDKLIDTDHRKLREHFTDAGDVKLRDDLTDADHGKLEDSTGDGPGLVRSGSEVDVPGCQEALGENLQGQHVGVECGMSGRTFTPHEAKLKASVSWILTKAYGSSVPFSLQEPFYENAKGQLQVKPQLINLMISSELYCQACANMFCDTTAFQWQGHWSIIQVLSRKGIYVVEDGETIVTETVLMHTAPFRVAAHLALIDALMKAYTSEIASIERIVRAVRCYSTFSASNELPGNAEEALMFWINKTCSALAQRGDLEIIQGESNQKVRIVSKMTPREPKSVSMLKNLMEDLGDGCCVAAVIAFYQPDALPVTDVCLNENVGIADSLYNLRLIRTFCDRHLQMKCFHFTYEDLLYGKEKLRENVLVFLAELFFMLEAAQQGGSKKDTSSEGAPHVSARQLPSPSVPQVSGATKRSFQKTADEGRHRLEKITACPSVMSSRQPLLQKRSTRRSQSLSLPQERDAIRRSVLAWQDDQDIRDRGSDPADRVSQSSTLLENVSMSWDADTTRDSDFDPVSSADLAEFEVTGQLQSQRSNLTDPSHPEFIEVVSVTPGQPSSVRSSASGVSTGRHEPLMPAKLRPAKEKINHHSKAEERGDRTPKKKVSPMKLTKGKLSPPGSGSVHGRVSPAAGSKGAGTSPQSSGSSMDETVVTPLASAELAAVQSDETVTSSSDTSTPSAALQNLQQQQQQQQQTRPVSRTGYEAFVIAPDSSEISILSPRRVVNGASSQGDKPAVSYTLESNVHDSQTAREAGLPVIGRNFGDMSADGEVGPRYVGVSREGSIGSSRSSGDFSDHESHKIHQDHKAQESLKHSPRQGTELHKVHSQASGQPQPQLSMAPKSGQLITDHLPGAGEGQKKPGTTSFAEIRRMKGLGKVDNSGLVYMQQGQEDGGDASGHANRVNLKSAFTQKSEGKSSTFGHLPKETTWQQSAQRQAAQAALSSAGSESSPSNGDRPATSELSQLRLKLEEKRREIERKKQRQEVQTAKMRQRLGKAAFMRVISKKEEGEGGPSQAFSAPPGLSVWKVDGTDGPGNFSPATHALLQERLGQVARNEPSRPSTLATISPSSSNSTSASESPSAAGRLFSREGGQPISDVGRRRWFHGSDPEGELINSHDMTDDAGGIPIGDLSSSMMQSCPPSMVAEAFGYSPRPSSSLEHEARASPIPKGPGQAQEVDLVSIMQDRSQMPRSLEGRVSGGEEQEEYDQSLDKLNRSLTELQGEIKKLSLQQQEQFRATQQSPQPDCTLIPAQDQHPPQPVPKTVQSAQRPSHHPSTFASSAMHLASASLVPDSSSPSSTSSVTPQPNTATPPPSSADMDISSQEEDASGFFVSFGEDTPRKSKPKLGRDREGVTRKESSDMPVGGAEPQRVPPLHGGVAVTGGGGDLGSNHSGSHHSLQSGSDDSSSGIGFVLGQESVETTKDTEMQRKKERLMQQQMKRKEEQERKRLQKELETQRRQEQKMLKEEEQEKKKAEEKARREAIFQQYMQKKLDQDVDDRSSAPTSAASVTRRERGSGSQPRPKSMFAKARPGPSDRDEVSSARRVPSHSSQEDLSAHTSPTGSTAPLSPFRLNPNSRGNMRKAVSCNQLTQNGSQGASTYRRPISPEFLRYKRSGPYSQDSGSETSSVCGSNASDYTGPKLFVKPSSKSNRHIIINALSYCCLAGIVNTDMKKKVLEEIARSAAKHFLILFRDHGCQYRGLYSFDPDTEEAYKIVGIGPRQLTSDMVEHFYKYNSGGKSFIAVTSTKHLSVSIDAVVLQNIYWKSKAASAARR